MQGKKLLTSVTNLEFFGGRPVHTSNPQKTEPWLALNRYIFKIVPQNALKMHSLALPVLRFLCKTFFKLLKFTLQNTIPSLYGYKLKKDAK